mgnify:CR=1 FL=1
MKVVILLYNLTCFFIGHRNAPDALFPLLLQSIKRHITDYYAINFVVGHCGNFDAMTAKAVIKLKQSQPDIKLTMLLPYPPGRQATLPPGFDNAIYPTGIEKIHPRQAIIWANRYMVDNSDFLIAYACHSGNATRLCQYAYEREKQGLIIVENLAQKKDSSI